jgi:hypothetical protein
MYTMSDFFADPYEMDYSPPFNWSPYILLFPFTVGILIAPFIVGEINDRDHTIESLKDTLREKKAELDARDTMIANLRDELDALTPKQKMLRRKFKRAMRRLSQTNDILMTVAGFLGTAFILAALISLYIVTRSEPTCYVPPGY